LSYRAVAIEVGIWLGILMSAVSGVVLRSYEVFFISLFTFIGGASFLVLVVYLPLRRKIIATSRGMTKAHRVCAIGISVGAVIIGWLFGNYGELGFAITVAVIGGGAVGGLVYMGMTKEIKA
jgi:hypothetical protein